MPKNPARFDRKILCPKLLKLSPAQQVIYDRVSHSSDLLMRADQYIQAERQLPEMKLINWPRYLLLGHAAELGMKALLAHWGGYSSNDLRDIGHNLEGLLNRCREPRIALDVSNKIEDTVIALNDVHCNLWARYPSGVSAEVVVPNSLLADIDELLDAIRTKVRGNATRFEF